MNSATGKARSQHSVLLACSVVLLLGLLLRFAHDDDGRIVIARATAVFVVIALVRRVSLFFVVVRCWLRRGLLGARTIDAVEPVAAIVVMIPSCPARAFELLRCAMDASPVDVAEFGIVLPAIVLR